MRIYDNGIYRDATPTEIAEQEKNSTPTKEQIIVSCKAQLSATDYKAVKYAEGWYSEEEYAPIKAERQALRNRINELERALTE